MKADWARAPSGWAEPVRLTNEQRDMIRATLAQRRLAVFKDTERQDALLKRIEGALTYLHTREGVKTDPHRSQERIAALHKALGDVEKALLRFDHLERTAVEHGGAGQLASFRESASQVRQQAERALDAIQMPKGAHDPHPGGHVRLIVREMAAGWSFIFKRKPSAKNDGAFATVANIVLGQIGKPEIGKDALRTILKGAGF